MPLPDYSYLTVGTAIEWKNTGGDKAMTLTSLANDSARQGVKSATLVDGTLGMPEVLMFYFQTAVASAATDYAPIELWISESDSATAATRNAGNASGADAAYSNPDTLRHNLFQAGEVICSNSHGTSTLGSWIPYSPVLPYLSPIVRNASGQSLSSTAADHLLRMVPLYREIED